MNNFEDLTVNIRSAFRLLFSFVQTFNGIVQFIESSFGLSFEGDQQLWGKPLQNNKRNLNNKDFLEWFPIYCHAYEFKKQKPVFSFSIILQCDTGLWDARQEGKDIYYELDQYGDVKISKTKIIFGLCEGRNIDIGGRFNAYSEEHETDHGKLMTKDAENEFSIPVTEKSEKEIFFKVYDLSDFKDQKTATVSLKKFVSYLKGKHVENFELVKDS